MSSNEHHDLISEELEVLFPDHQRNLYIVPHPPPLRGDKLAQLQLSHKNVIKLIRSNGVKGQGGFLIQKLPKVQMGIVTETSEQESYPEISELRDSLDSDSGGTSQCCVYCPSLRLDKLLLFKVVTSLNTNTVGIMMKSARDQIQALADFFRSLKNQETVEFHIVVVVIWNLAKNTKVSHHSEEIIDAVSRIEKEVNAENRIVSLTLTEVSMDKKENRFDAKEINKVTNLLDYNSNTNSVGVTKTKPLLSQLVLKSSKEYNHHFLECEFQLPGLDEFVKIDEKGMNKFVNIYFPAKNREVITVPDIDHSEQNKLDCLDEMAAESSNPYLNIYKGELHLFWPQFHNWFINNKPTGVLLHGLSHKILSRVMEVKLPFMFEIDWIHFNGDYVIVFEVGLKTSENPKSVIKNKLNQIFTKTIPVLKLLTWYALVNYKDRGEKDIDFILDNFNTFFHQHFKAIVFIGNVEIHDLKRNLCEILSSSEEQAWDLEFKPDELSNETLNGLYVAGAPSEPRQFLQISRNETSGSLQVFNSQIRSLDEIMKIPPDVKICESQTVLDNWSMKKIFGSIWKYLLGVFAIAFFAQGDGTFDLLPVEKEIEDIDKKFSGSPKKRRTEKIERTPKKKDAENILELSSNLSVKISRQQLRLLEKDPKFLILRGEPGSGKTVLLLAKAKTSASNPETHKIYFYVPAPKLKLKEFVANFVKQNSEDGKLEEKFEILTDQNLNQILRNTSRRELKKSVLLMDEFYFGCDKSLSSKKQEIFNLSVEVFPYLQNCWIACVVLNFFVKFTDFLSAYLPIEMFCIEPLSIQFRTTELIAKFCTNIVHRGEIKGFSSCRVPGVYTSSQAKVILKIFRDPNEITIDGMHKKFEKRRWAVAFCDPWKKQKWREKFQKMCDLHGFENYFVVSIAEGPSHCDFSGGEVFSLILIIDKIDTPDNDRDFPMEESLYALALSRAQYEIEIFVHEGMKSLLERWENYQRTNSSEAPGIARDIYLSALSDTRKAKTDYDQLVNKYIDRKLHNLVKGNQNKYIIIFLGRGIAIKILNVLLEYSIQKDHKKGEFLQNESHKAAIKDALIHAIQVNHRHTIEWILQLCKITQLTNALKNSECKILSYVCFKPDLIDICIKNLSQHAIGSRVSLWKNEPICGFIPVLCFSNVDITGKCLSHALDQLPEALARTALDKFYGKDALQHSLDHGNLRNVRKLLFEAKWRKIFLSEKKVYRTDFGLISVHQMSQGFIDNLENYDPSLLET